MVSWVVRVRKGTERTLLTIGAGPLEPPPSEGLGFLFHLLAILQCAVDWRPQNRTKIKKIVGGANSPEKLCWGVT